MPAKATSSKKLGIFSLATVIFFTVSGGPYGLEPLLYYCNGSGALLLLVIVPLLWDVPIVAAILELNSLMPKTGGYYQWVKRALGLRWAFYEGWWSWLYTFIDLAIYPQLFIMYASLFFPQIAVYKVPICLAIVWSCAYLNIIGIVPVGRTSVVLSVLVLIPFLLLIALGISHLPLHFELSPISFQKGSFPGMAILTLIWNFVGWDNVTTYSEEVKNPVIAYLRAISVAFAFIFILYFGITVVSQNSGISLADLRDKGFPVVGAAVAGNWLSAFIAAGGMVSSLGLFLAVLLSISRIPEAMAQDKLLPSVIQKLHPRYKTPYISIIICAIIISGLVLWTFGDLLIIDITVYFAGIVLELISLIVLRKKEPGAIRPFKIPLNIYGLCALAALPLLVYLFALGNIITTSTDAVRPLLFSAGMIISGDVAWRIIKLWNAKSATIQ